MTNPSVAAVMLANGRPEMTARAIRSFLAQTYENRMLLVWDTGSTPLNIRAEKTAYCPVYCPRERSIGELRNDAIGLATNADIVVTMDSDDLSHPRRIEEQVALLVASGAEACGYNEVLFCHEECHCGLATSKTGYRVDVVCPMHDKPRAWLYSNPSPNYAIGASLAFWRDTWKRRPFPHLPIPGNRQSAGEDAEWLKGVRCVGTTSLIGDTFDNPKAPFYDPRLICSIHGGNSQAYDLALPSPYFKRAAQFDDLCRSAMEMKP